MALWNFSSRERTLTLGVVLLVGMWGVLSWIGWPLLDQFQQLEQQVKVASKKLEKLQGLSNRRPAIEQAYQRYAAFRSGESDELSQGAFLDELEQLARAGNVQISLKPRPVQRQERVSRLGIEVEVASTQEAILAFLDRLLASPSLVELDRLRLSTTASKDAPIKATLIINKVVVHN